MAIALFLTGKDETQWQQAIHRLDPNIPVYTPKDAFSDDQITFAVLWRHPQGLLQRFKNLRAVCSAGAGLDHIRTDPDVSPGVVVYRIVPDSLIRAMVEYATYAVLFFYRRFDKYAELRQQQKWLQLPQNSPADIRIGVMGAGKIGEAIIRHLRQMGFVVTGWAKHRRMISDVVIEAGLQALPQFLSQQDILLMVLPAERELRDLLNEERIKYLKKGIRLINLGRGDVIRESDLLMAIASGQIEAAFLDVFATEPLSGSHPFYNHPRIHITPHIAALTDVDDAAAEIAKYYRQSHQ
jgi:glyoxylate/hydroxypyruvate reductase A